MRACADKLENSFAWHDYAHSRSQDRAGSRQPRGARGAAAAMLAHGVEKSRQRPRRDLSRLACLCGRRHGAGGGKRLIDELMEAATAPGTSYLHQWRRGDVVMWDNRATMHRGRPWPAHEARLMVRTTISATEADGVDTMRPPSSQAAE